MAESQSSRTPPGRNLARLQREGKVNRWEEELSSVIREGRAFLWFVEGRWTGSNRDRGRTATSKPNSARGSGEPH